jgi:hypothetical protein
MVRFFRAVAVRARRRHGHHLCQSAQLAPDAALFRERYGLESGISLSETASRR